ncbi:MAG: tRNA (adenosine(37)-N6)-dimethylallyltransferase MiaA, partial [Mycobacteriaceae bacterium]
MRSVAVVGPTATGKSALALTLAEALGGEVVNADAMQLYRGMDIGTAKTPHASRRGIPHHQIDTLAVTETASVAQYQRSARQDVEAVLARSRVPIIVGGSGLYVQALLDDLMFPPTDPGVRARWESALVDRGAAALHGELDAVDPEAARNILASDGRRIVRALEVVELTGQPFSASAPTVGTPRWGTVIVGLDRDTVELDERIEARTRAMFATGFVEEVEGLVRLGLRAGVTARRALGYTQVLDALDGVHSLDHAQRVT